MVARPFNHIGPGQSTGFIVPDLVKELAEAKRDRRTTIAVGTLSARRDYTDVRDICLAYLSLIELGRPGEVYNVCSGISHSGDELLNQLFSMSNTSGITSVLDPMKQRPIDTPNIYGTADKLFLDTGWTPTYSLEQTLSDVITEAGLR
jgi:GDP-4-dehydro-6-deoxy-D-mannose reductase